MNLEITHHVITVLIRASESTARSNAVRAITFFFFFLFPPFFHFPKWNIRKRNDDGPQQTLSNDNMRFRAGLYSRVFVVANENIEGNEKKK